LWCNPQLFRQFQFNQALIGQQFTPDDGLVQSGVCFIGFGLCVLLAEIITGSPVDNKIVDNLNGGKSPNRVLTGNGQAQEPRIDQARIARPRDNPRPIHRRFFLCRLINTHEGA
jgi:hypothetical protein